MDNIELFCILSGCVLAVANSLLRAIKRRDIQNGTYTTAKDYHFSHCLMEALKRPFQK